MAKIQRKKVTVDATYYNFDSRYEEAMASFEDVQVISVSLMSSVESGDSIKEVYLVFYQEKEDEGMEDMIGEGDFVYWDMTTGPYERNYETVEKVEFDEGIMKVFFLGDGEEEGGFMPMEDVVLIAKKKDRKDC